MKVGYVSSFPPRECGVATFTEDLANAIDEVLEPGVVVAVNEAGAKYDYDGRVKFQVERDSIQSYLDAASWINDSDVDVVCLQHEFKLFGGERGEHITAFLKRLRKPVTTTLHTVHYPASSKDREILNKIIGLSDAIVVVGFNAVQILRQQHSAVDKIRVIPHGCPDIPQVNREEVKASLGFRDRILILTFGLISSYKGVEYVVNALPALVKQYPEIMYAVVGETHPEDKKKHGESYREMLTTLVNQLGLAKHVTFINRYLTKKELITYLQATDIYVVSHTAKDQVSSGTLTYAIVAGKAVVSTPFPHARELLSDGCGLLCEFQDSASIAKCVVTILENDGLRRELELKSYAQGRRFLWSEVAREYIELFEKAANRQIDLYMPQELNAFPSIQNIPSALAASSQISNVKSSEKIM